MNTHEQLTRREFLKTAAAFAGLPLVVSASDCGHDSWQCGCANKGFNCDQADKGLAFHMAIAPGIVLSL